MHTQTNGKVVITSTPSISYNNIYGGYDNSDSDKSVSQNTVSITDATITGPKVNSFVSGIYGGYSEHGLVKDNSVKIFGTSTIKATHLTGGYVEEVDNKAPGSSSSAIGNEVNISCTSDRNIEANYLTGGFINYRMLLAEISC